VFGAPAVAALQRHAAGDKGCLQLLLAPLMLLLLTTNPRQARQKLSRCCKHTAQTAAGVAVHVHCTGCTAPAAPGTADCTAGGPRLPYCRCRQATQARCLMCRQQQTATAAACCCCCCCCPPRG
jgi:hypothetical protein